MRIFNNTAHNFASTGFSLGPGMNTISEEHAEAATLLMKKYPKELQDGGTLDAETKAKAGEIVKLRKDLETANTRIAALEEQNRKLRILVENAGEITPEPVATPPPAAASKRSARTITPPTP
jgi:hypothetical protein